MAIGSNHVVQSCIADLGDTSGFVPELWSQEILQAYKHNITLSHLTDSKVYYITTTPNQMVWLDGT